MRPERTASMPMRAPPSTRLASLFSLIRRTLGLEGRLDLRHGGGQTAANEPVDALGDRDAEHRRRRLVGNAQHDPHTVRGGIEAEPALQRMRGAFMPDTAAMTLGLVQARDHALVSGPVELLRFGDAESSRGSVSWPIEGGVLAAEPGGRLRVSIEKDRLVARVEGYH